MNITTRLQRGWLRRILVGLVGFVIIWGVLMASSYDTKNPFAIDPPEPGHSSSAIIVASKAWDDISWLHEHFSDRVIYQYIVDKPWAQFTVPKNKGREAMVYLSYMIDAYEYLPDVTVFIHSQRYQWHNDDPLYDSVPMLKGLQLPYIISQGYANIRCVWGPGCPYEIKIDEQIFPDKNDDLWPTQAAYKQAFQELFPGEAIPPSVGVACCAQFAVTREKIRERPLDDYKRYRQWLLDTPLDDSTSGRIFEYSWHIIFGKPYTHCPNAKECYCNIFGLCNLDCLGGGEDICGEVWPYPPFSTLPKGWPTIGWDGESRSPDDLEALRNAAISSPNIAN